MKENRADFFVGTYASTIKSIPVLSHEKLVELAKEYRNGSYHAKNEIIRHNLRLVVSIAYKYTVNDESVTMDLIQEGNEGLIRAVEKYEHERNFQFSTYATTWIRYRIELYLNKNKKMVSVPVHIMKLLNKVSKVTKELENKGSAISPETIAKHIGMEEEKVSAVIDLMQFEQSLNFKIGDNEDQEIGDLICDTYRAEDNVEKEERLNWINLVLDDLSSNHREVICMFFGLRGHPELNRSQIAIHVGLSRERVRQIVNSAIKKMEKFVESGDVSLPELL